MKHINTYLGFINESEEMGLSKEATDFLYKHLRMSPFKVRKFDSALNTFAESWTWNPETRRVDVKGTVTISTTDRIPPDLKFGVVTHNFYLSSGNPRNSELGSADFTPRGSVGNINISYCHLKTLKDCTPIVRGSFICDSNDLTSLEGSPQSVGQIFKSDGNRLTSLKGITPTIGYSFRILNASIGQGYNGLETLKDGPTSVKFAGNVDGIYIPNGMWGKKEGWIKAFKEILGIEPMAPEELADWFNYDPEGYEDLNLFDENGDAVYQEATKEMVSKIPNRGKKIVMLMEMIPGEAEKILDDWIKEDPLNIDLLDELPDIKAGVLKRTGLKDLSKLARGLRKGTI
jgi:hypothetical protein